MYIYLQMSVNVCIQGNDEIVIFCVELLLLHISSIDTIRLNLMLTISHDSYSYNTSNTKLFFNQIITQKQ